MNNYSQLGVVLSEYTGGNSGWGNMISKCACYGAVVSEYECDESGTPVRTIFNRWDDHVCEEDENEN